MNANKQDAGGLPATGPFVDRLIRIFRDKPHDDTSALVLIEYAELCRAAPAGGDVPFDTVRSVCRALTRLGHTTPESQEEQAARAVELVDTLCREVQSHFDSLRSAPAGGDVECFVREMRTSKGSEFFVVVRCNGRELTPHMYAERWKAEYDVASWQHLLCGAPEPDLLAYGPSEDSAPAGSGEVADEVMKIADFFEGARVFVTSREKIKHPEGTDLFDEHVTRLLRVAALLRKLQQGADGWLSIESAPKDGTRFLAATDSGYPLILQWCCEGYFRDSRDKEWMPDKWQPLPPASLIDWRDHYRQECAMRLMDGGVKTAAAAYEAADRNIHTLERLAVNRAASQGQEGDHG